MGILSAIFGKAVSTPVEAIGNVLDKLFTSDEEKAHAEFVLEKLKQHPFELQVEINKIEASHQSLFVAGWRPFIGYVCGFGLLMTFIINPVLQWLTGDPGPQLPTAVMIELVLALLGLGTLRTIEKIKGLTK